MGESRKPRLADSLRGFLDSGLATAQTRLELLAVEVQEEKLRANQELEDKRTGADLDAKLREAGILPGHSSADDVLARLTQQEVTIVTPRIGQSVPTADKDPA